jgi:gliding motility-associated-like protein
MIKIMRKLLAFVFVLVSFYSKAQLCAGSSGTITPANPGGLINPTFSMNPGGFTPNGNGQFVVSPNVTTTYTLYTTGQNTLSATVTQTSLLTVTVFPQPSLTPTITQANCTNSLNSINVGLTFNPPSPVPGYTLNWTPLPGTVLSPQQTTATALTPGPYTLVVVAAGGCGTTVFFTVTPQPAPAIYTVNPFGSTHSITCLQPTVVLNASNSALTYTWSSTSFTPIASSSVTLDATNLGTWSVTGTNPTSGCTKTFTFLVAQNTAVPQSTITPLLQTITCSLVGVSTVSVFSNPTVNISHFIYAPQGGIWSANSHTAIYFPGGTGTFTHELVNDANGCKVTKTFTVTSTQGYPTYSVTSALSNFTLGCTTKATATISIDNADTTPIPGGAVSYTILGPPTTPGTQSGTLSSQSVYTINVPGTWTVIVRDFSNNCETRTPISIIQNTFTPNISAIIPLPILDCNNPTTILEGVSETPGVSYNWAFGGTPPGNVVGNTITVNYIPSTPTKTVINTYTLTITENNNTCKSFSIIPILQNVYKPNTAISNGGTFSLTCATQSIQLTNISTTGITGTFFPTNLPVIGYLWEGPTPQEPLQVNTTYLAATIGTYTLTGKDLNNGCTSTATIAIGDNKIYPLLNSPIILPSTNPATLDCGSSTTPVFPTINNSSLSLTYLWTTPPGASVAPGSLTSRTLSPNLPGTYTLLVTNTVNSCATKITMSVVPGALTADFDMDQKSGYAPLTVNFTNKSSSSLGTTNINSLWSFGNGNMSGSITATGSFVPGPISVSISPSTVFNLPGTYTVTIFSVKGACSDTAIRYVKVEIPSQLVVPNVFTPNGDKINDLFFLKSSNLSEIVILIYDRWGHKVYDLTSTNGNIEWDGKNMFGKECAEGTYFYVLKATGKDGKAYDKSGTINLFR